MYVEPDSLNSENIDSTEILETEPDFSFLFNNNCEYSDNDRDISDREIPCKERRSRQKWKSMYVLICKTMWINWNVKKKCEKILLV